MQETIMTKAEVTKQVFELLSHRGFEIPDSTSKLLKEDLGMESLDLIELNMDCEKHFDVSIPDEDADRWTTVDSVIDNLEELLAKK